MGNGYIALVVSGSSAPSVGIKSRKGYLTPAVSRARKWAMAT